MDGHLVWWCGSSGGGVWWRGEWCRYICRLFKKTRWPSKCERCVGSKKASANASAQAGGCKEVGIYKDWGRGDIRVGSLVGCVVKSARACGAAWCT